MGDTVLIQETDENGAITESHILVTKEAFDTLKDRVAALESWTDGGTDPISTPVETPTAYSAGIYESVFSEVSSPVNYLYPVVNTNTTTFTAPRDLLAPFFAKVKFTLPNVTGTLEAVLCSMTYEEYDYQGSQVVLIETTPAGAIAVGIKPFSDPTLETFEVVVLCFNDASGVYNATITGLEIAPAVEV